MLIILSPSKTINAVYPGTTYEMTQPYFTNEVDYLSSLLRKMSKTTLAKLMKMSEQLTEENYSRYQNWKTEFTEENAHPALFSFSGGVYQGLDAEAFDQADITFAQYHLVILSGLYGVIQPMDLIQPYRLEMGTRLKTKNGTNLYQYWGNKIALRLNQIMEESNIEHLCNLASDEYFKSIDLSSFDKSVINFTFKERRGDEIKFISFNAKKARGMMAKYIIKHRITKVEELKGFDEDNYVYNGEFSTTANLVFIKE